MNIHKAAGIIIQNKKLLVSRSRNKEFFIAPGGKLTEDETAKQALVRELKEELQITVQESDLEYFNTFTAPAAGQEDNQVIMEVFSVKAYTGILSPDNEIEEIAWIDSTSIGNMRVGSIFEHYVLPRLKEEGLVK